MMRVSGKGKRRNEEAVSKCRRLTMRAVDSWVRAAFSGIFLALSFFRFDGESQPCHLPLTLAVGRLKMRTNYETRRKMGGWTPTPKSLEHGSRERPYISGLYWLFGKHSNKPFRLQNSRGGLWN